LPTRWAAADEVAGYDGVGEGVAGEGATDPDAELEPPPPPQPIASSSKSDSPMMRPSFTLIVPPSDTHTLRRLGAEA
jgi:hypothetical protein